MERGRRVGGECVHRGTIPSKALRETALSLRHSQEAQLDVALPETTTLGDLLGRVSGVVDAHVAFQRDQLERNGVVVYHGIAKFTSPQQVRIQQPRGQSVDVQASHFVIATGSVPRKLDHIDVDHEFVLDSDSILSQPYLPKRLIVLGGGVIACEYATVFKQLGVQVTLIDRSPRPLGFMDDALVDVLVRDFEGDGCQLISQAQVQRVERLSIQVAVHLEDGRSFRADKVFLAVGRVANVRGLGLGNIGVERTARGHLAVDGRYRTTVPHVLAVGDVIGFPGLASTSMEQGRRAVRLALGLPVTDAAHAFPVGVYTVPELASAGLTEAQALDQYGRIRVGVCNFDEVARGQIAGNVGLLKLLSTADRSKLLGVHVACEGATEVVHMGLMALLGGLSPSVFVDNTFNFPTLAEAYRIAALALERPTALRESTEAQPVIA